MGAGASASTNPTPSQLLNPQIIKLLSTSDPNGTHLQTILQQIQSLSLKDNISSTMSAKQFCQNAVTGDIALWVTPLNSYHGQTGDGLQEKVEICRSAGGFASQKLDLIPVHVTTVIKNPPPKVLAAFQQVSNEKSNNKESNNTWILEATSSSPNGCRLMPLCKWVNYELSGTAKGEQVLVRTLVNRNKEEVAASTSTDLDWDFIIASSTIPYSIFDSSMISTMHRIGNHANSVPGFKALFSNGTANHVENIIDKKLGIDDSISGDIAAVATKGATLAIINTSKVIAAGDQFRQSTIDRVESLYMWMLSTEEKHVNVEEEKVKGEAVVAVAETDGKSSTNVKEELDPGGDLSSLFCSEACAETLMSIGILNRSKSSDHYGPKDFLPKKFDGLLDDNSVEKYNESFIRLVATDEEEIKNEQWWGKDIQKWNDLTEQSQKIMLIELEKFPKILEDTLNMIKKLVKENDAVDLER